MRSFLLALVLTVGCGDTTGAGGGAAGASGGAGGQGEAGQAGGGAAGETPGSAGEPGIGGAGGGGSVGTDAGAAGASSAPDAGADLGTSPEVGAAGATGAAGGYQVCSKKVYSDNCEARRKGGYLCVLCAASPGGQTGFQVNCLTTSDTAADLCVRACGECS